MDENKLKIDSNNKNLFSKKVPKEYFVKKIDVKSYPKIRKNLDLFFNDINKYFETSYDNKYLIVGKKLKDSDTKIKASCLENYKKKLFHKKATLKKSHNILKTSNNSNKNSMSPKSKKKSNFSSRNITDEKRKNFTSVDETQLKLGQRFVDDKELDSIFNLFKELQRLNKNKNKDFLTFKELNEYKSANLNNNNKEDKNVNNEFNKTLTFIKNDNNGSSNKIINIFRNKENLKPSLINYKTLVPKNKKLNINDYQNNYIKRNINKTLNDFDNYKTSSTGFTYSNNDINNKTYLMTTNNNIIKDNFILNNDKKRKNKMFLKQLQYISPKLDETIKKEMAKNLAFQENVLKYHKNKTKMQLMLIKYISKKIKKSKNKLLMYKEYNYRTNYETKTKLNNLQNKLNPEKVYNWAEDLHLPEYKIKKEKQYISSEETIRYPQHMKLLSPVKLNLFEKSEYITRKIPNNQLMNLKKNLGKIQKSYNSLHVNGVNLLKFEADIAKKLKGRKILNDYERLMSPSNFKSKEIYSDIGSGFFRVNTISSLRLYE
jgi:hypothetical protein